LLVARRAAYHGGFGTVGNGRIGNPRHQGLLISVARLKENLMSESSTSPGGMLRESVAQGALQVPGAPNALAGRMIEEAGFSAIYLSGAALSAGVLALPDVGLFSLTELVGQVDYLTARVSIPVIVDADTGFGDTVNVERTVAELERAGAAAIQLEDQELPKRCGHLSGKTLVSADAMCAKIRAGVAARADDQTVIIARTDARAGDGFDAAVERARQYIAAGADWIFPEALASREEFATFARAVDVPLMANMTEFGKSPLLEFDELAQMGYRIVIYPVTLLRVAMKAVETALAILLTEGTQQAMLDLMQTREELYELLEYETFEARDREYFS
jgi:methylisocitrate lyase